VGLIARRVLTAAAWIAIGAWGASLAVWVIPLRIAVLGNGVGMVTTATAVRRSSRDRKQMIDTLAQVSQQREDEQRLRLVLRRAR
jgi:hypothetical protein